MRDIAKDKEMCEAATLGEWSTEGVVIAIDPKTPYSVGYQAICTTGYHNITNANSENDAHFIAEAHQALPYWIAQYEAAQARISELEAHIERIERKGYV